MCARLENCISDVKTDKGLKRMHIARVSEAQAVKAPPSSGNVGGEQQLICI